MKTKRWQWLIVVVGLAIAARQALGVWRLYKSGEQVRLAQEQLRQEEEKNKELILPQQNEVDSSQLIVDSRPNWQQWWDLYIRI